MGLSDCSYEGVEDHILSIPEDEGDILHYGQKFHIAASSALRPDAEGETLYLRSQPATPLVSSKYSHFQEVSFVAVQDNEKPKWETVWEVVASDPDNRLEMEGLPVTVSLWLQLEAHI